MAIPIMFNNFTASGIYSSTVSIRKGIYSAKYGLYQSEAKAIVRFASVLKKIWLGRRCV